MKVIQYTNIENRTGVAVEVEAPPHGKHTDRYHYLIPMDSDGIAVVRVLRTDHNPGVMRGKRVMKEHVEEYEYPIKRAVAKLLDAGTRFGITQQAKAYLEGRPMKRKTSKKGTMTKRPDKILPRNGNGRPDVKAKSKDKTNGKTSATSSGKGTARRVFDEQRKKKADRSTIIAAMVKATGIKEKTGRAYYGEFNR